MTRLGVETLPLSFVSNCRRRGGLEVSDILNEQQKVSVSHIAGLAGRVLTTIQARDIDVESNCERVLSNTGDE